ncbi:MAG TPA: phosphopantetheine-binding protein [Armatimonadota bacterium]|jgi:acyl carrier protein
MLDESTIREAARAVVQSMTGALVADDEALISSGLIDSLSILKLIGQLEERLNIAIPAAQLQPDDFENVDWIVDTVGRVGKAR